MCIRDSILTVCKPVWNAYEGDYTNLNEPEQVKLKYTNAAKWGYDGETRKVFAVMKDRDCIDRSLSSHDAVGFVPDTAYNTLRKTLQNLHQYYRSAPSRGALRPADVASVEIEFHSSQKLAADRIYSAWLLMLSIARHRCLSGKRLQDLPPGQFAPLIAENHAVSYTHLTLPTKRIV